MGTYLDEYAFGELRNECVMAMDQAAKRVIEAKAHCMVESSGSLAELGEIATALITGADIWPDYTRSSELPRQAAE